VTPPRRLDSPRAWKFLARVRWENVALLAAVTVALVALALSGRLAGPESSDLPADIGLVTDPPERDGKGSGTSAAPTPDRPQPRARPSRRHTPTGRHRGRKRQQRRGHRGKRRDLPAVTAPVLAPPASSRSAPPQGS